MLTANIGLEQDTKIPSLNWDVTAVKVRSNAIKVIFSTTIPTNWMIVTEKQPTKMIALELNLYSIKDVEIGNLIQTKGEKIYPKKLFELYDEKIEVTRDKIEFELLIQLKENQDIRELEGYITYMLMDENHVIPPEDYDFHVNVSTQH